MGAQKNVTMRQFFCAPKNAMLKMMDKKISQLYAQKFLLSGPMEDINILSYELLFSITRLSSYGRTVVLSDRFFSINPHSCKPQIS